MNSLISKIVKCQALKHSKKNKTKQNTYPESSVGCTAPILTESDFGEDGLQDVLTEIKSGY